MSQILKSVELGHKGVKVIKYRESCRCDGLGIADNRLQIIDTLATCLVVTNCLIGYLLLIRNRTERMKVEERYGTERDKCGAVENGNENTIAGNRMRV